MQMKLCDGLHLSLRLRWSRGLLAVTDAGSEEVQTVRVSDLSVVLISSEGQGLCSDGSQQGSVIKKEMLGCCFCPKQAEGSAGTRTVHSCCACAAQQLLTRTKVFGGLLH